MNMLFLAAAMLAVILTATIPFGYALSPAMAQEQPEHEVTVTASDESGEEIPGMWVSIRLADGEYFGSGYTPLVFPGTPGDTYIIKTEDYDGIRFQGWEDGSTNSTRTVTLATDTNSTALDASYDLGESMRGVTPITYEDGGPSLTVEATTGNQTLNIWTVIDQESSTESEATYTVYAGNYQNHTFASWSDGDANRTRTLTISENTTITAEYVEAEHTIVIPFGAFDPANTPYEPAELSVEKGDTVVVHNVDVAPHSVTSGTGPEDAAAANAFETGLMFEGDYAHIETADLDAAEYDYYCFVHPFMTGKLTVTE